MALVVRSEEPAEALAAAIQAATQAEVPGMAVNHVMYASTLRRAMVAEARTQVWLLGLMALAALGCAVVGIVQLVADHVRMRLPAIEQARSQGARSSVVLWQAWCPALVTVGGGGLLGLGVAWALPHGMASGLLGETDGLVLAGAVAVGALVMLVASLIPARQALGITSVP